MVYPGARGRGAIPVHPGVAAAPFLAVFSVALAPAAKGRLVARTSPSISAAPPEAGGGILRSSLSGPAGAPGEGFAKQELLNLADVLAEKSGRPQIDVFGNDDVPEYKPG